MKPRIIIFAASVVAATLATLTVPVSRTAVWNITASVPTGLYLIRGKHSIHVGERVAIQPPHKLRKLLAERGYLPVGVPLLKRVAAVSDQRVCRFAHGVTIDGKLVGVARSFDQRDRPLPAWSGCYRLAPGELFVMNPDAPGSFDGRYFGVLTLHDVIGRATPVWTDEAGDGDHVWFADPFSNEVQPKKKETETMRIGYLEASDSGYAGRLQTVALDMNIALVPVEKSGGTNPPDFKVIVGDGDAARDIGAGWKHVGKKVGAYVSVQFDDPMFARPVRAKLFHDSGDDHILFWSRQPKRPATL